MYKYLLLLREMVKNIQVRGGWAYLTESEASGKMRGPPRSDTMYKI